jgi:hypothetical protein
MRKESREKRIVNAGGALAAGLLLLGLVPAVAAEDVNCIAAVVNGRPVTKLDVLVAAEFGLYESRGGAATDTLEQALRSLVERRLALEVARESAMFGAVETAEALAKLRAEVGEAAFESKLKRLGLAPEALLPYLAEKLQFDKAIASRFGRAVTVSRADLERYYRETYVPERRRAGLEPEPLEKAEAGITAVLGRAELAKRVGDWLARLREQAEVRVNRDCLGR